MANTNYATMKTNFFLNSKAYVSLNNRNFYCGVNINNCFRGAEISLNAV